MASTIFIPWAHFILVAFGRCVHVNACFQGEDAEDVLRDLPSSAISLQLSAYFYAVQIYSILSPCVGGERAPLYDHAPSEVIQKVTQYVTHTCKASRPEGVQVLVDKFNLYTELLEDYNQAKVLQGLGRGKSMFPHLTVSLGWGKIIFMKHSPSFHCVVRLRYGHSQSFHCILRLRYI